MQVEANGIYIEVEDHGNPSDPAILLIMGFGTQLIYWPMDMINALVGNGFRVVTFDNRDVGLSQKFDDVRAPHLIRQMLVKRLFPWRRLAPYDLNDMAKDTEGVMDALGIEKAHIVGASMGGMIAQVFAADHPDRTSSLTPIMSSTNAPGLPGAEAHVRRELYQATKSRAANLEEAIERGMTMSDMIVSKENHARRHERAALLKVALERSFYPAGRKRQMSAIIETGDLRKKARRIAVPTLVLHGSSDPLIPHPCGQDIAANVDDARFELIEDMGHDLPPSKLPVMVDLITENCRAA